MMSRGLLCFLLLFTVCLTAFSFRIEPLPIDKETPKNFFGSTGMQLDTIPPIKEREGDFVNDPSSNPFDLSDPPAIEQEVTYDPETGLYIITERIGNGFYRPPTYLTFEEYVQWRAEKQKTEFFSQLAEQGNVGPSGKDPIDRYEAAIKPSLVNRLFGDNTIDIRPNGNIDLTFGADFQKVENPILTERQRRQGGFDFDMAIQMNVVGRIGNKLELSTNYNTQATFDFDNQLKLEYAGTEDDIIQRIEAGNVALPLRSSLIQGNQSLFGIKTELKFGRLSVTSVLSQQKSQRQNIQIQGGTTLQQFEVFADQYDENRHFFLTHYNRENYEQALVNLPNINTLFKINKIEIWVTNTRNATEDVRDIVALSDLGEPVRVTPNNTPVNDPPSVFRNPDIFGTQGLPSNDANPLYRALINNPRARDLDNAVATLQGPEFGLNQVTDFEKVRGRLLQPSEYSVHPDLGYISLNVNMQPEDVLGIAFEYTYNGQVYQVGEFTNDIPISPDTLNVIFTKMLKSTAARVDLPIWDLMMKNVYSIGAFQVNQQDFKLDIFYQDPGGGELRFIPDGPVDGRPLINLFNLDRLNATNDPVPNGVFDFVPGVTINPRNGRVILPVLEPFGTHLENLFEGDPSSQQYVYQQLYDSTITFAREFPEFNRFVLRGSYKSSVSSEISLGAFNIPRGSVIVTAGGQQLVEGRDFDVDYNIGRVKILNESILNSGIPINVAFEDNTLFGFQTQTLFGTRLDYTISDDINIGGTILRLSERPFTQKVNIGDDPIANTVYGLDVQYSTEAPWLTKAIDKIPLINTRETSTISFSAEGAALKPGHPKAIDGEDGGGGNVYLDDFEGSAANFDLRTPAINWIMSSTPRTPKFPEADSINSYVYNINRARMAWYRIDPILRRSGNSNSDPYTRQFAQQDVFRNISLNNLQNTGLFTFDMAYYPKERGSYNFDAAPGTIGVRGTNDNFGIDEDGDLLRPEERWGGIMRSLETNDFEAANIEFVELWMLSPFLNRTDADGNEIQNVTSDGKLFINLGNISEDILKDSRKFFENGLPRPGSDIPTDTTIWSRIPRVQAVANAFDNDPELREAQDVGLDGFDNVGEQEVFQEYLESVQPILTPQVYQNILDDPAGDDYLWHSNDTVYGELGTAGSASILDRYKAFNNTQGNSLGENSSYTNIPDGEDPNQDNTLSETESFFEYEIDIQRENGNQMAFSRFVVDSVQSSGGTWYQLRVPIEQFAAKYGGIQDFRSIRFMRMYMTGFDDEVILRFARLQLVRNQWRRYRRDLRDDGIAIGGDDEETTFDVGAVNIEQNSARQPFPYVLPPGIQRETSLGAFPNALQNEQSLAVRVCNLNPNDARGIYKLLGLDLRNYKRMKMFVHAEPQDPLDNIPQGDMSVFIRLGRDFVTDYYEYEIPLTMSEQINASDSPEELVNKVWPEANAFDFPLELFRDVKLERNSSNTALNEVYEIIDPEKPENKVKVVGNPDLGFAKTVMIGVRNNSSTGVPHCAEVWVNELRLNGLDEAGGTAAVARLDVQMADFGNATLSGAFTSIGWGSLDQQVDQRSMEKIMQYDFATNLELGKFFPKNSGIRIPFYAQYSTTVKTPEFDPYQLDITLADNLKAQISDEARDSIRSQAEDFTSIRSFNFTNVRKERTGNRQISFPWDISNFSFTYAYTHTLKRDPTIERNSVKQYRGAIDYNYSPGIKPIEPFKKLIKSRSKWLAIVKDFNFNPLPNNLTFRTEMNRHFGVITYRFSDPQNNTFFDKRFFWDRVYGLQWNLTKNLNLSYNATNNSVIDENDGPITDAERTFIWDNIKDLGRTKNYNQNVSLAYNLPTRKIPLLDWTQIRASYNGNYTWSAASLNVDTLGNVIQNGSTRQLNGDFDFTKLYNKSKYLKKINSPARKTSGRNSKPSGDKGQEEGDKRGGKNKKKGDSGLDGGEPEKGTPDKGAPKDKKGKLEKSPEGDKSDKKKEKKDREPSQLERVLLRPLMMVRKARVTYSENRTSVLPGFTPTPQFFGLSEGFSAPGWGYGLGFTQPDSDFLNDAAGKGWITNNIFLNQQVLANRTETYDIRLTVEPFKDFRIELNASRNFTESHSEYFKTPAPGAGFQSLNSYDVGSLNFTFLSLGTMFDPSNVDNISETFQQFESNREVISNRLGVLNPRSDGSHSEDGSNFSEGYGRYQQDVLIPAFLAAYSGADAETYNLDVFSVIPKPNWRLTYNGLNKIKGLDKIFASFTLSHGYTSTVTVNQFQTDLAFDEQYFQLNENTNNFFSPFEIPDLVISEQLSPLIGIDMRLKNDMTAKVDIKRSRNLALSLTDFQLVETKTNEFTIGFGYRVKGFKLPFAVGKNKTRVLENDLNFQVDVSVRDDKTINHLLDQNQSLPTRGSKTIRISPAIDYAVNQQVNIRIFFDRSRTIPATSASFPITNTQAGVTVRFALTQ